MRALALCALVACSGGGDMPVTAADAPGRADAASAPPVDAALPDAASPDAASPDAPPIVGTVTVQIIDADGVPIAGADVVFHDAAGKPIAHVMSGEDGRASQTITGSGGVTLVYGGNLMSALGVAPGQSVILRGNRSTPAPSFVPMPQLPPPPSSLPDSVGYSVLVNMPTGSLWFITGAQKGQSLLPFRADTRAIAADGTYTLEATLQPDQGPTFYSRRSGIPASDLNPQLPPWSSDPGFPLVRRRIVGRGWTVAPETSFSHGQLSTFTTSHVQGDALYVTTPALEGDLLTAANTFLRDNINMYVRIHEAAPIADRGTLDIEAQRPRSPRRVRVVVDRPVTLTWDETTFGVPSRFVYIDFGWLSPDVISSGHWFVLMPAGERRIVFPDLPAELAKFLPPTRALGASLGGQLTYFDDTAFAGYADVLTADYAAELGFSPPARSANAVSRHATVDFGGPFISNPPNEPVFSLTSDPPAVDGRVQLTVGEPLHVTAQLDGEPHFNVRWEVDPLTSLPVGGDTTLDLQPVVPGQSILISATNDADQFEQDLIVEVLPPDCMKTWPLLRPTHFGPELPNFFHIAVAVRRDGSPVVATAFLPAQTTDPTTVDVVAWDGLDWSDLAAPIAVSDLTTFEPGESPLALALDAEDRPVVAYQGDGGIVVARIENGAWQPFGAPLAARVAGDMALALDAGGNPVIATLAGDAVSVWRWSGTDWQGRTAFPNGVAAVRSLVMDGDVPIVSFEAAGGTGVRGHVVRMDADVVDLGAFDDDATAAATPRPLLALPSAGQPLVAWLDPVSADPGADLLVRVSQQTASGWAPVGTPLTVPAASGSAGLQPHAVLWDAARGRAVVATAAVPPVDGVAAAEVRFLDDGSRVCAPMIDLDASPYTGSAESLGMALDPTGGYVVAFLGADQGFDTRIIVESVRP